MKLGVLGYGGALLLVAVALAILVDAVVSGGPDADPRGPAAVSVSRSPAAPAAQPSGSDGPVVTDQPAPQRRAVPPTRPAPPDTPADAAAPCPAASARYQRFGDTVRVSVHFPGSGYIAAFVEATGREAMTKSATNTGRPQTFEFAGVPEGVTERIGVTVITGAGLRTCDVQKAK